MTREYSKWMPGVNPDYASQLGFEEGFEANGIECLTLTTPWLDRAREICAGRQFDQVWLEVVWSNYDKSWLDWLCGLAPVRVGWVAESLQYTAAEVRAGRLPGGKALLDRLGEVRRRLRCLTHALPVDERDVDYLRADAGILAMWCPVAIPERFLCERPPPPRRRCALFMGSIRPERAVLLNHPDLRGLLVHQPSTECRTIYPYCFPALYYATRAFQKSRMPGNALVLSAYLQALRRIRRAIYARWLAAMRTGAAVVNLPSRVKSYPGRVVEAMAAGRPVISDEIPDRPRTRALFEHGQEILLYRQDDPAQLADQIRRILTDPDWGERIAAHARRKLRRFHTTEQRVAQVLAWIDAGEAPSCC